MLVSQTASGPIGRYTVIDEWNQQLMSAVYHSDEFCALCNEHINDTDYQEKRLSIMQKYLMLALDDRYIRGF